MLRVISPAELQLSDRSRSATAVLRIGWHTALAIILMTMPVLNLKIPREELETYLTADSDDGASRRTCRLAGPERRERHALAGLGRFNGRGRTAEPDNWAEKQLSE